MNKKRMEGRIALITGGGTGIGKAIAILFSEEGAKVVISGRRKDPLEQTVNELTSKGHDVAFITGDVSIMSDAEKMVKFTAEHFGGFDTLVNSAGVISRTEQVETTSDKEWNWQMDINLKGVFHTTKHSLFYMMRQGKGSIVNIGSISANLAAPGYATYCATKGGVLAYTRVIALQYAKYGIRANVVSPGMVQTPMSYVDRPNFDEMVDKIVEDLYPIKRVGLPIDVAYAVLYLASDEAGYVTGQNLIVDGGFSIK